MTLIVKTVEKSEHAHWFRERLIGNSQLHIAHTHTHTSQDHHNCILKKIIENESQKRNK